MTIEEFLEISLIELETRTRVTSPRWSRYFSGQPMSETTLSRLACALNINPSDLLSAINQRREIYRNKQLDR